MRWEERLMRVFDDLEQQADGLALADRDVGVAEQRRAEYAALGLDARVHASLGATVQVGVLGLGRLDADLVRAGDGWCLLTAGADEWIVRLAALTFVRGLAGGAVPAEARSVTARLGLASALRGVAESRAPVVLHRVDGTSSRGLVARVGGDFVEVRLDDTDGAPGAGGVEVVPFAALAAVRRA